MKHQFNNDTVYTGADAIFSGSSISIIVWMTCIDASVSILNVAMLIS